MISGTGIWSLELRFHEDEGELADAAAELEELGFDALWYPGFRGGPVFERGRALLDATSSVTVAPGILNLYRHEPDDVTAAMADLPERFVLGLGVSHPELIDEYKPPLGAMRDYLDAIDVPGERLVLAALGPKMLDLSAERALGAHPYFTPVEHTRFARERLGEGPLIAPECAVVFERDARKARELARTHTSRYLQITNYRNNLKRFGFTEEQMEDGGTDKLVDAVVAWGDEDAIAARLAEHRDAGADHVCWQVIHAGDGLPREQWRRLSDLG